MKTTTAKSLDQLLRNYARIHTDRVIQHWPPIKGQLQNFHHWADGRPALGGFLVSVGSSARRIWVALVDWKNSGDIYLVLFPENLSGPIAEIHDTTETPDGIQLRWKYAPRLRDGKNEQRRAHFIRGFGSCDVYVRIPTTVEELEDFLEDLDILSAGRSAADELAADQPAAMDTFPEGKLVERLHFTRERSPALIRRAKDRELAQGHSLRCACCGFDFEATYGEAGRGFIEAHHTKPVSTMSDNGGETRVEDIALVCSNCHRMLHRRRPWLELHELRKLTQK